MEPAIKNEDLEKGTYSIGLHISFLHPGQEFCWRKLVLILKIHFKQSIVMARIIHST